MDGCCFFPLLSSNNSEFIYRLRKGHKLTLNGVLTPGRNLFSNFYISTRPFHFTFGTYPPLSSPAHLLYMHSIFY